MATSRRITRKIQSLPHGRLSTVRRSRVAADLMLAAFRGVEGVFRDPRDERRLRDRARGRNRGYSGLNSHRLNAKAARTSIGGYKTRLDPAPNDPDLNAGVPFRTLNKSGPRAGSSKRRCSPFVDPCSGLATLHRAFSSDLGPFPSTSSATNSNRPMRRCACCTIPLVLEVEVGRWRTHGLWQHHNCSPPTTSAASVAHAIVYNWIAAPAIPDRSSSTNIGIAELPLDPHVYVLDAAPRVPTAPAGALFDRVPSSLPNRTPPSSVPPICGAPRYPPCGSGLFEMRLERSRANGCDAVTVVGRVPPASRAPSRKRRGADPNPSTSANSLKPLRFGVFSSYRMYGEWLMVRSYSHFATHHLRLVSHALFLHERTQHDTTLDIFEKKNHQIFKRPTAIADRASPRRIRKPHVRRNGEHRASPPGEPAENCARQRELVPAHNRGINSGIAVKEIRLNRGINSTYQRGKVRL